MMIGLILKCRLCLATLKIEVFFKALREAIIAPYYKGRFSLVWFGFYTKKKGRRERNSITMQTISNQFVFH